MVDKPWVNTLQNLASQSSFPEARQMTDNLSLESEAVVGHVFCMGIGEGEVASLQRKMNEADSKKTMR